MTDTDNATLPDLPAGVWEHYKKHLYLPFGYGHDANIEDRVVVSYIGLELDGAHTGPRLAVRTAVSDDPKVDAWRDLVHAHDGSKCLHGRHVDTLTEAPIICRAGKVITPRFRYLGPGWEGPGIRL